MASGSGSPERARADVLREQYLKNEKERELAIARLEIRAEMRSNADEEITGVIDQKALEVATRRENERVADSSLNAPPQRSVTVWNVVYTSAKRLPPWGLVAVLMAGIAAYTILKLRGALP